jgi:hypothetical protein
VRSRAAQVGLILAGLLIALYPVTLGASPDITCRGVVMSPGQTCAKTDGSARESYEQRVAAADAAKPVLGIVGLAVAGFGVTLLAGAWRRPDQPASVDR